MQVEVKEIQGKKVFKPVSVVLNFENKEDFDMFFNIVSYNRTVPEAISKGRTDKDKIYEHCQTLLTDIHTAMQYYA
jgi:hypothetical protein